LRSGLRGRFDAEKPSEIIHQSFVLPVNLRDGKNQRVKMREGYAEVARGRQSREVAASKGGNLEARMGTDSPFLSLCDGFNFQSLFSYPDRARMRRGAMIEKVSATNHREDEPIPKM